MPLSNPEPRDFTLILPSSAPMGDDAASLLPLVPYLCSPGAPRQNFSGWPCDPHPGQCPAQHCPTLTGLSGSTTRVEAILSNWVASPIQELPSSSSSSPSDVLGTDTSSQSQELVSEGRRSGQRSCWIQGLAGMQSQQSLQMMSQEFSKGYHLIPSHPKQQDWFV